MAYGTTASRVALTDGDQATLVAAPGVGRRLVVKLLCGSNAGAEISTVDIKEGTTAKFSFAMAANGGGFMQPFPDPWELPENTALTVEQSASVVSYVSAITRVDRV